MDYIKFSIRIPSILRKQLETEAEDQGRTLNQQLSIILKDRYHAHAPPITSTQKHSSQFHPKVNGRRVKAKTKAEIN